MWRRRQSPQALPNQEVPVPVNPATTRQRRHRLRSSGASNNSSLSSSCHSHQWVITPRPHYSLSWKEEEAEEDFLTVDKSVPSVLTTQSTWHEEAHWMSFQNAVLKFTSTLTMEEEQQPRSTTVSSPVAASFDGSFVSAAAASSSNDGGNTTCSNSNPSPPPVRHIFGVQEGSTLNSMEQQSSEENTFLGENSSASEGESGACRTSPDDGVASVVGSNIIGNTSSSKKADRQPTGSTCNETLDAASSASVLQSMASELSETKMRLALAQAERDELEFALLMAGGGEASP